MTHSRPSSAQALAVATPCWPAPVSAITRFFAHALGEQSLAERVVDLVRAGVEQVFALEVDFCAAERFGEALGEVERRGAAGVISEQRVELGLKGGVGLGDFVFALELE